MIFDRKSNLSNLGSLTMLAARKIAMKKASNTSDNKDRLKELLLEKSYLKGDFILASGEHSKVFFDVKMTSLNPEGAWLAADLILDMIEGQNIQAVGGIAIGACPIVSAICVRSFERGAPIPAFYIRKEEKKHGTQKKIEGLELKKGARVLIVDDVATKGGSMLEGINPVRECGCEIVKTIVVVDREQGAAERLAKEGYILESVFKRSELEQP
jgi:orotate phosphoribosyltransferase